MSSEKTSHFFEPGSLGWDESWDRLAGYMDGVLRGGNGGRRSAYQALKNHCRLDNQAIPSESAKRLMGIVLKGVAGGVDRCVMESEVFPGERWQYMGTFKDVVTGVWQHEFRHRHLDTAGGRVNVKLPCRVSVPGDDGRKPSLVTVHTIPDDGSPF